MEGLKNLLDLVCLIHFGSLTFGQFDLLVSVAVQFDGVVSWMVMFQMWATASDLVDEVDIVDD